MGNVVEMREGNEAESMVKAYEKDRRRSSYDLDMRPVTADDEDDDFALEEETDIDGEDDDDLRYRESRDFK